MSSEALPAVLQHLISQRLEKVPAKALATACKQLSQRYRQQQPGQHLPDPLAIEAYLATRLPATFAVMQRVLTELQLRLPDFRPQHMLDLGAGPGTASLAALAHWPELALTLYEGQSGMLAVARNLFQGLAVPETRLQLLAGHLPELPDPRVLKQLPADLLVLAYVLNELQPAAREKVYQRLQQDHPQAVLVLVEPGTPVGFQHLLAARQFFLRAGRTLVAPCPAIADCPMAAANDWCHFSQRLPRTALHRQLKQGEQNFEDEKFSYLIFAPTELNSADHRPAGRIVRHPHYGKGKVQLSLCTAEGLQTPTLGKSHPQYKQARKWQWGEGVPLKP